MMPTIELLTTGYETDHFGTHNITFTSWFGREAPTLWLGHFNGMDRAEWERLKDVVDSAFSEAPVLDFSSEKVVCSSCGLALKKDHFQEMHKWSYVKGVGWLCHNHSKEPSNDG